MHEILPIDVIWDILILAFPNLPIALPQSHKTFDNLASQENPWFFIYFLFWLHLFDWGHSFNLNLLWAPASGERVEREKVRHGFCYGTVMKLEKHESRFSSSGAELQSLHDRHPQSSKFRWIGLYEQDSSEWCNSSSHGTLVIIQ